MRSRDSDHYKDYCKIRNQVRRLTRKARILQEKSIAENSKTNQKKFWQFTKSQTKTREGIGELKVEGQKSNTDGEAAFLLDQFTKVFTVEPDGPTPHFPNKDIHTPVENLTITVDMVKKKSQSLNITKSAGPDGLHPQIFNSTLSQHQLPSAWKEAIISPIFKKGDRCKPENYRPVSLTCIASKLIESFIRDHILQHMKLNNLLSSKQFGFLKGRSTVLQLLRTLNDWIDLLDNPKTKNLIDTVHMDFQKAFDKVPHSRLLSKLQGYGISGQIHDWVKAFLSGRSQRVNVRGTLSDPSPVTSGIPQGSVLGPILFVLFINDLPDKVKNTVYLFADDTKIFGLANNQNDTNSIQEDLDILHRWSDTWLLKFHPGKCKI